MALLAPTMEIIQRQKVQPTEGEWTLLKFLLESLDDTYEIFFQPYLNGDNPDIAIMRKNSGVLFIEVKDWNLDHYYIDDKGRWRLYKDSNAILKSPLHQVGEYKDNLFKLHSEELYRRNMSTKKYWATVNCAVYFHNETEEHVQRFLYSWLKLNTPEHDKYQKYISYYGILGNNSLNKTTINVLLSKMRLDKPSYLFDEILYNSIYRYLKPPFHQLEEGVAIKYTPEQEELIRSEIRPRRKIKGVAGSGKTLVLAKRAVNAHLRTKSRVLILTYNLALKNYIHDRISDVREDYYWDFFYITNYHQFFKTQANNYNLEVNGYYSWQDIKFFDKIKDSIQKYDVVLIDEIQDYMQEWIDIIAKYFIHSETEFFVCGDEKQNIYNRELDENYKMIARAIPGIWNNSLNKTHRFAGNIGKLAMDFQKKKFGLKYTLDELLSQSEMDFETRIMEYYYCKDKSIEMVTHKIFDVLTTNQIHSSDVGILCSKVEFVRDLDYSIRTFRKENTTTTFESQEEYTKIYEEESNKLKDKGFSHEGIQLQIRNVLDVRLEEIRRMKKNHFWMKTGTIKLATIHSFKGWEINTLFLIIEGEEEGKEFTNAEMVYTGLTRARQNLIVFNLGNIDYDDFFKNEMPAFYPMT